MKEWISYKCSSFVYSIATFLGDVFLDILQEEKIGPIKSQQTSPAA